jgi:methionyl-tRNA formyltransferase
VCKQLIQPYWAEHGISAWRGPAIAAENVNSRRVHQFVETLQPDVAFAMCTNDYFGKRLRDRFAKGVFLWHEGITPEYKGLYSPFWAAHNLEFDRIGYSLLRMNDDLDAGEIFVQGRAQNIDPRCQTHDFMGHKAILDSLPQVEEFIARLTAGTARPIFRQKAEPRTYTYPGITDFIRQRRRLRKAGVAGSKAASQDAAKPTT